MLENQFKKWNIVLGWTVFSVSLVVYSLTVEPTVSFWDSGELISASAKLQIAHPPGAPFLQMFGAFFSLFAKEASQIAFMVNYVSVLSSAFTILFLFWTITRLLKDLLHKSTHNRASDIMVLGSGVVGSLAFTFSDSFWFNATETEVYAAASLVLSLLFWLGLRWVDDIGDSRGNRWLLLISFVTGLTFGIQFMGFLVIPAVGLLFYFKRYRDITFKNFVAAHFLAVGMLMMVFKFSFTLLLKFFGWGEVFFVNTFGLPFHSGSLLVGLVILSVFLVVVRYTIKRGLYTLNTILFSIMFLLLGCSTWFMLPIRANAQTVINENDPANAKSLLEYYNREQYPAAESPFYGAYYSDKYASNHPDKDDSPKYEKNVKTGKYEIINDYKEALQGTSEAHSGWLPRMWSDQNAENYMRYYGLLDFSIKPEYVKNRELQEAVGNIRKRLENNKIGVEEYIKFLEDAKDYLDVHPPTLWQNLEYLFHFQFGYMYWRYFMWNFVGRQNDVQGRFDGNGEWLSGISAIDGLRLGNQEKLPDAQLQNKGRNTYYFLPLILGLFGLFFHASKDWKRFWVLCVFFLFTGLAIQFYTNPPIFQPRERDYSLVGSFYVFAIWIGLGVYAVFKILINYMKPKLLVPVVLLGCFVAVPVLMAQENWNDHDRSGRYTALTMAKMYLDSTQKDVGSILFTIGDIDTFPLWYAQEIEKYRTDTRVIVTTYFNVAWYIDQMKRQAYESPAIPSQLTHKQYRYGTRDVVYYAPVTDKRWSIQDFMKWISSDAPQTKVKYLLQQQGRDISGYSDGYLNAIYYPTYKLRVPVNREKVLDSGLVKEEDALKIVDYIDIDLPPSGIGKGSLLMMDIIANNNWERPIYFSGGSFDDSEYVWMTDYLQLDGLVYKLVPIKTKSENIFDKGRIDSDLMLNIVKTWDWENSGSADIYHDPQTRKQFGVTNRIALARLLEKLLEEQKPKKAKEVINMAMENIPLAFYGYPTFVEPFLSGYYKLGETAKADELFNDLSKKYRDNLEYYLSLDEEDQYAKAQLILSDLYGYNRLIDILLENGQEQKGKLETSILNEYLDKLGNVLD